MYFYTIFVTIYCKFDLGKFLIVLEKSYVELTNSTLTHVTDSVQNTRSSLYQETKFASQISSMFLKKHAYSVLRTLPLPLDLIHVRVSLHVLKFQLIV